MKFLHFRRIKNYNSKTLYQIENNFSIEIFNQYAKKCDNEDDYSLCTLIKFYGKKLLFTGDLTEESELIKNAGSKISKVDFYLAGGNGTYEANNEKLLKVIRPEFTVIAAAAGATKDNIIDSCNMFIRYATKRKNSEKLVYLMGEYVDRKYNAITGDITFTLSQKNGEIIKSSLRGSKAQPILNETDWYQNNKK